MVEGIFVVVQNSVEKWKTYVNHTTIFSVKSVVLSYKMWRIYR